MEKKITVLGAGAFGTAIATLLAHNGNNVTLWCYEPEVARDITTNHHNGRYFSGIALSPAIQATSDLQQAFQASSIIFQAVPVKALRTVFTSAKPWITQEHHLVTLSKGIETETLCLPSAIITQTLGFELPIAVLSGPNLAHELARQIPSAAVIASRDHSLAQTISSLVRSPYFKVFLSNDIVGVQVCGALKNVMALALGAAHGFNCKENTIALLITQALHEMGQVSVALGGKIDASYGAAGLGDLVLCCMGGSSRNFKIGRFLGEGHKLSDLTLQYPLLPEGVWTLRSIKDIAKTYNLELPLCHGIYNFVFEDMGFDTVLDNLMQN